MSCAGIALGRLGSLGLIRQKWKYQSRVFVPPTDTLPGCLCQHPLHSRSSCSAVSLLSVWLGESCLGLGHTVCQGALSADSCSAEVTPSGAVVEVQVQLFDFPSDPSFSPRSSSSLTAWDPNVLLLLVFQARSWETSRYKLQKLNCQELWGALSPQRRSAFRGAWSQELGFRF